MRTEKFYLKFWSMQEQQQEQQQTKNFLDSEKNLSIEELNKRLKDNDINSIENNKPIKRIIRVISSHNY
uniref:Uncharacterized protein n=1 Tax=candidate division CPR3 bacterium TaxID=2268181 RepID=A0A7C5URQ3_UNCC3